MRKKNWITLFIYIFLIFYCCLTLFPFVFSIFTSLKTPLEIDQGTFFPKQITFEAYEMILFKSSYPRWVFNSILVALAVTAINLIINTMTGYALARIPFKGRNIFYRLLLLLIMIPAQVTIIPAYIIVSQLQLINTPFSIIFTSAVNIAYIFMMRQFFVNFPKELEESAHMDGLNRFGIFWRIVLPTAMPALATQTIFVFMGVWNEFLKPLLYITNPDQYLLTQGLNQLQKTGIKDVNYAINMAGAVLSVIPILLIYIFLNRYFINTNDQTSGVK